MPEHPPFRAQGVDRVESAQPADGERGRPTEDLSSPSEDAASSHPSYKALARRIAGWTSNLLAMAVVLVLTLGAGHYILDWTDRETAEDAREETSPKSGSTIQGGRPVGAQFPVAGLQRVPWQGNRESIRQQLRQQVQQQAVTLFARPQLLAQARRRQPAGSEQKLLALTAARAAQAIEPGRWEVHEFIGAFPLAVSFVHVEPTAEPSASDIAQADPSAPAPTRRMVAWAMAVPAGPDDAWSVYLQTNLEQPASDQAMLEVADAPPLPPGVQPTLALTTAGGGLLLGFTGEVSLASCREHFEHWGQAQSPPQTLVWSNSAQVWHVQIQQAKPRAASTHIQLATDARGRVLGLLTMLPPTRNEPSSKEP